jgi:hypothetical protein
VEAQLASQSSEAAAAEMDVPSMDVPMALPQYAQQGAIGYQDPSGMMQQQQQQPGMMMGQGSPQMQQQPGMMMGQGGYMQ